MNVNNTMLIVIQEDSCFVTDATWGDLGGPDAICPLTDGGERRTSINLGAISETNPMWGWRNSFGDIFVIDPPLRATMDLAPAGRLAGNSNSSKN